MKLGKFLKLDKISMRSSDYRGSHEAHFFVFERCLIYTVALNDSFLFHGCFWLKTTDVGSVFNAKKCINHLQLKDWYRTVVLETPSLIDLTIELKDKSDLDPYEIPNIFLSQKQLKSFLKSIDCESESQF